MKESTRFYSPAAANPGSHPPLRHGASRRLQPDRDNVAKKLNRAELSRLLEGKRALSSSAAPISLWSGILSLLDPSRKLWLGGALDGADLEVRSFSAPGDGGFP